MNMQIVRMARHANPRVAEMGYRNWVAWLIRKRGWGELAIPWHKPEGRVQAFITNAVWYAHCPGCGAPIIVDDREPVLFCPDCFCAANEGHPYRVDFVRKTEVEELFAKRRDPRTRNWLPGESFEDLRAEQESMGEF